MINRWKNGFIENRSLLLLLNIFYIYSQIKRVNSRYARSYIYISHVSDVQIKTKTYARSSRTYIYHIPTLHSADIYSQLNDQRSRMSERPIDRLYILLSPRPIIYTGTENNKCESKRTEIYVCDNTVWDFSVYIYVYIEPWVGVDRRLENSSVGLHRSTAPAYIIWVRFDFCAFSHGRDISVIGAVFRLSGFFLRGKF